MGIVIYYLFPMEILAIFISPWQMQVVTIWNVPKFALVNPGSKFCYFQPFSCSFDQKITWIEILKQDIVTNPYVTLNKII